MFKIVVFTSISQSCGGFCWNAVEYQHGGGVRSVVESDQGVWWSGLKFFAEHPSLKASILYRYL